MSPKDALGLLTEALKSIYWTAGREIIYETDSGELRKYWPKRYWQALKRAIEEDEVLAFVERVVTRDEPTRGFGYLEDAGRLDLTVEALVVDESKPWHSLLSEEAFQASRRRLAEARARIAAGPRTTLGDLGATHVDKGVVYVVDLPQTVMSVDRSPTQIAAGRYDVSLMRHWAARIEEDGLRSGDVWFLVGMSDGRGAWVRALDCAVR